MRATRALLRRRTHLRRTRAALLAHVHNTHSQYTWPESGKQIASKATRDGVAARLVDPAVPKSIAVDLALSTSYDQRLSDVALSSVKAAKHHDAHTRYLLQTVPGIGQLLSLGLLYAMHDMDRFPTVQDFVSSCRLGKCAQEAAGKRVGPASKKIGNAPLQGAFSEAAALFLRNHPAGQKSLARLEKKHAQGKALTLLAHKRARAVYYLLKHQTAFHMATFLQS